MLARLESNRPHVRDDKTRPRGMFKKAILLTRPTMAATLLARPESAKTASSPRYAPLPKQLRSKPADTTFHPRSRQAGLRGNRRYAATTSQRAGSPPSRSTYCWDRRPSSWRLSPSEALDRHRRRRRSQSPGLCVPVSLGVSAVASRTLVNNAG